MNGNHEPKGRKKCPLLKDWCIGGECAQSAELERDVNGISQKFTTCWANAVVIMLSEINAKTPSPPVQKIHLPGILRG